jgi:hypothetical protein
MHWKLKALIQNGIARLPDSWSYEAYYRLQRVFGGFRRYDPTLGINAGLDTCRLIHKQGRSVSGAVVFELGTGRVPLVPLVFWLQGAERIVTIDANPYLRGELVDEALQYIRQNAGQVAVQIGDQLVESRFSSLLDLARKDSFSLDGFLELCQIQYLAPGDGSVTRLDSGQIDIHTSYTVFEHIPPDDLRGILAEGNRIVNDGAIFVHRIDYSDHFAHADKGISLINFLQYSDEAWARYAGNRYMYMNRLRHDDYLQMFAEAGHDLLDIEFDLEDRSMDLLNSGDFRLDSRFAGKSREVLAMSGAWIVSGMSKSANGLI